MRKRYQGKGVRARTRCNVCTHKYVRLWCSTRRYLERDQGPRSMNEIKLTITHGRLSMCVRAEDRIQKPRLRWFGTLSNEPKMRSSVETLSLSLSLQPSSSNTLLSTLYLIPREEIDTGILPMIRNLLLSTALPTLCWRRTRNKYSIGETKTKTKPEYYFLFTNYLQRRLGIR